MVSEKELIEIFEKRFLTGTEFKNCSELFKFIEKPSKDMAKVILASNLCGILQGLDFYREVLDKSPSEMKIL